MKNLRLIRFIMITVYGWMANATLKYGFHAHAAWYMYLVMDLVIGTVILVNTNGS